MFTEANPDKGTKTSPKTVKNAYGFLFTEANPDKGTKTEEREERREERETVYRS